MSFLCRLPRRTPLSTPWIARSYASSTAPASSSSAAKKDTEVTRTPAIPLSSCPPDTVLTGLNFLKGQSPVLALPDDQYPEWLWNILRPKEWQDDGPGGRAERAKRRHTNRGNIKDRNFMSTQ
ncbi:hypothetical protein BDN72DRAFT_843486 [Pluteus cervinus]|uniref:Uncharacterized protein n=1 Tax=Pluteus cervinus TaxID=181527 RepID=A0ACD3AN37_9AGAR|nr:hypothetical protein BDN72DRAFT_843486 [Pluteus cervinus]